MVTILRLKTSQAWTAEDVAMLSLNLDLLYKVHLGIEAYASGIRMFQESAATLEPERLYDESELKHSGKDSAHMLMKFASSELMVHKISIASPGLLEFTGVMSSLALIARFIKKGWEFIDQRKTAALEREVEKQKIEAMKLENERVADNIKYRSLRRNQDLLIQANLAVEEIEAARTVNRQKNFELWKMEQEFSDSRLKSIDETLRSTQVYFDTHFVSGRIVSIEIVDIESKMPD